MSTMPPQVIVLSGTNGDLARRKLRLGLVHLDRAGMPASCWIVGTTLPGADSAQPRRVASGACAAGNTSAIYEEGWGHFVDRALLTSGSGIGQLWSAPAVLPADPPPVEGDTPGSPGAASMHPIATPNRWRPRFHHVERQAG